MSKYLLFYNDHTEFENNPPNIDPNVCYDNDNNQLYYNYIEPYRILTINNFEMPLKWTYNSISVGESFFNISNNICTLTFVLNKPINTTIYSLHKLIIYQGHSYGTEDEEDCNIYDGDLIDVNNDGITWNITIENANDYFSVYSDYDFVLYFDVTIPTRGISTVEPIIIVSQGIGYSGK